jgi:hypothetical protein
VTRRVGVPAGTDGGTAGGDERAGGILDVFPISAELPYRLEFFGDEVESIRRFEPETQRSIGPEKGSRSCRGRKRRSWWKTNGTRRSGSR